MMSSPAITTGRKHPGGTRPGAVRTGGIGRRRMAGVAAVEFALVVPLLLVILFGIIDFGFMLYDKAMLTNAAREGARAGIVLRETRMSEADIQGVAGNYCQEKMIRLRGSSDCLVKVVKPADPKSLDDQLEVSVEYAYDGPIVTLIGLIG